MEGIIQNVGSGAHVSHALGPAQHALQDGMTQDQHVKRLARIAQSANAERDYHCWLANSYGMKGMEPYVFKVQLQSRNENEPRMHDVACIPPHELIAWLWGKGKATREQCLVGPENSLPEFWREAAKSETYADLPVPDPERTIPLLVHFDGCEVFNLTEFGIWQFSSLVASSSNVLDQNFLSVIIESELIDGELSDEVHGRVARMFAWSFNALLQGKWPHEGMDGEPLQGQHRVQMAGKDLAGGMCALCVGFQADMKARREVHRHDRWFRTTFPCQKCLCSQPRFKKAVKELSYADFSENAAWVQTRLTERDYMRTCKSVTPWVEVPGFKPLDFVLEDFMHNWSLGIARDLTANCIVQWLENHALERMAAQRGWAYCDEAGLLRHLHLDFRSWIRRRRLKVKQTENIFTRNRLNRTSRRTNPSLTTRAKAVCVDALVLYLGELASAVREHNVHDRMHLASCAVVERAAQVQSTLDGCGLWLTNAEAALVQVTCRSMLKMWGWLARESLARRQKQWRLKPKLHDLDEMVRKLSWCKLNPRALSCSKPESFLGKIKRVARHTHRGHVSKRTCQRYWSLLGVRAAKRERAE